MSSIESEKLLLKIEFCTYLNIPFMQNRKQIEVYTEYAPAVIAYRQEYYSFIDTVLCVLVRTESGEYVPANKI